MIEGWGCVYVCVCVILYRTSNEVVGSRSLEFRMFLGAGNLSVLSVNVDTWDLNWEKEKDFAWETVHCLSISKSGQEEVGVYGTKRELSH